MPLPSPYCPQCGTSILTINIPCPKCQLGFIRLTAPCPRCGQPEGEHSSHCPRPPRGSLPFITCPLCGGRRHRKDAQASKRECAWRQWAREQAPQADWSTPATPVPPLNTRTLALFEKWLKLHPNLEAGSVPAERILRQRAREAARK